MIIDLLKNRCSIRRYQARPVPQAVVEEILEAGRLSPSGGNEQPWAFGVITDPGLIVQIAQAAHHQRWIEHAPLLVVLCTLPVDDARGGRDIQLHRYPRLAQSIASIDQRLYWAINQEEHQTKIAGTHMVLAALEHGVGSCWVSLFDVEKLAELLNLPPDYMPTEILVFGYPEGRQVPARKKNLDTLVFYNRYEAKPQHD
jgi:nitroreductase